MTSEEEEAVAEDVIVRRIVWDTAAEMVDPLIEKYGIYSYTIGNPHDPTTITALEQHIDLVMTVASWLLEKPAGETDADWLLGLKSDTTTD